MKQYKFRVFDIEWNYMIDSSVWVWNKIKTYLSWRNHMQCSNLSDDDLKEFPYIIMQYVWKNDLKWNCIFEWDFIKLKWCSLNWEVYFDEDRLQFRIRNKSQTYDISYAEKITGNIYLNKELLNN